MREIEAEIGADRFGIACRKLEELLSWCEDPTGEIAYVLGSCELARGRNPAAGAAWARVVPGSVFSERAIRGRMSLLRDSGECAAAEHLVICAAEDRRNDRSAVRVLLAPLFSQLGRIDEAERLIEDRWEHLNALGGGAREPALKLLRLHIELTSRPAPVEKVRAYLDRANKLAPQDDRVWLGRANLAIRTGAFEEAGGLLDACLLRHADDVAVWRARLSWAIATNRVDEAQEGLTHLPADASSPAQVHRLVAWLSSCRHEVDSERRALELLVAADPADLAALARLYQLEENGGQPARAAEILRKRAEIERLRARYEELYDRNQPIRDAVEMAHLAEQLGRAFEARAFMTVAISEDPESQQLRSELARLDRRPATIAKRGQTLADVVRSRLWTRRKSA
jgi:thioredoxin-like negative regulator of GroEL